MLSCATSALEIDAEKVNYLSSFHQLPLSCWLVSQKDLKILAANPMAAAVYQYSEADWNGLNFINLFASVTHDQLLVFLQQPSENGQIFFMHKKGGEKLLAKLYVSQKIYQEQRVWQITAVNASTTSISLQKDMTNSIDLYKLYMQSPECTWCYELEIPLPVKSNTAELVSHLEKYAYLIECNYNTAHLLGKNSLSEIIGLRLNRVLDFTRPEVSEIFRSFAQNNYRLSNVELDIKDLNNNNINISSNFFGVIEDGALVRIWGINLNITERKEAEKKIRLLACLVEETFDVLSAMDLDWKLVSWNKGAEKLFKITSKEIIGKNIREFIPDFIYRNTCRDEVRRILNETGFWQGEMSFTRPADKKLITLQAHFKQLTDENGSCAGYVFSATDITEKKESELQLRETENRFVEIADFAPVIIWMTDHQNKLTYVNKAWLQFTGISLKEMKEIGWHNFIHPDDLEAVKHIYAKNIQTIQPINAVYRLMHHSGEYRWIMDKAKPRILQDGTFMGYIGSIVDIHDQKIKEDQLRYQATMLEHISDVIITTNLDHQVLSWNNVAEEVIGIKSDGVKSKLLYQFVNFDSGKTHLQVLAELSTSGTWKGEVSVTNQYNGNKRHFFFTMSYLTNNDGKKIAIMSVGRDITERKKASEKLIQSEQFYRNLIADSANGVLITDVNGTLKFASNAVHSILGYDSEEVLGVNCFAFIHPEDTALAQESFQREVKENPIVKSIEIRLKKRNGEWLWCLVRGHNQLQNSYVKGIVIYFHDNTANKKASDALVESEHRFRTLIRDIQVGVVQLDARSHVLLSNRAIHEMFLVTENEILGKSIYSFAGDVIDEKGEQFAFEDCPVYKATHHKTQVNDVVMGILRPKSGDRIWVMMNADPILDEAGNLLQVICSIKDIGERKKLENKLIAEQISHQKQLTKATIDGQERERREIGKELHDNFGQQLTTIKLFLDMAKSTADDNTNEMISLALKGVSDVINGMRQMSRNIMPPTLGDLGLIDSVFDLIESINRTQAINIEFDFFEFQEIYLSDSKQLMTFRIIQEQLNNIIKHAQAENVTIKLYNNEFETFLEIIDDGKGFDINTVKKGLGLANIRNRAEIFSGTATITSSPGNGCHVIVYVPNKQEQVQ
ncbi:PAS domain S-box protein [Chitinophagaceae bacterium LB-8]|uniref:histidine kinase n=1 Tax=Paraflavisolibacter caeni TaxID=2982496 RepID=A0A9X2XXX2_9BACT|nr:PAS domain S-box protein [Paraflavisolibacter caeni]MCU7550722.1 PAS domain S-box protein [Paraflavisolibacter caeni]